MRPLDDHEATYVAQRYGDGQRITLIARFYEWLRYWWACDGQIVDGVPHISPEAADVRYHPDLAFAGERTGILWAGQAMIRHYQLEYRRQQP